MKTIIAVIAFVVLAGAADARPRITVHPKPRPIIEHPYAVEFVLSYMLCAFHLFSLGPDVRPGDPRMGSCVYRMRLLPHPSPRRAVS